MCPASQDWTVEAIRQRRKRNIVAAIYCVYGDESHDETAKRVFAVAGIFGTQQEWDDLSAKWFRRTGGLDFHAADCESDQRDFAGNSHEQNHKLYRDLTKLLCSSKLLGHAMVIELAAHEKHFPDSEPSAPYLLGFTHVVMYCAQLGHLALPQGEVEYVFDRNLDKQHNATVLYDYLAKMPQWEFHPYLSGKVSFASRKSNAGIQAADLFARETMKHLDNQIGAVKRGIRGAMQALRESGRFRIAVMDDDAFARLVKKAIILGESLKGSKESEYQSWLSKHGYMDNMTMRINYLAEIDRLNK